MYMVFDFYSILAVLDFTPRKVSTAPTEDELSRMRPDTDAANYKLFRRSDAPRVMPRGLSGTESRSLPRDELHSSGEVSAARDRSVCFVEIGEVRRVMWSERMRVLDIGDLFFFLVIGPPPSSTLFPATTLFR